MVGQPRTNPFATRYTRPGAIPPLDATGQLVDIARLVEDIRRMRGLSIEGPHGTGKSTLLVALAAAFDAAGQLGATVRLRHFRDATAAFAAVGRAPAQSACCLDGWNVLGPCGWLVRLLARVRRVMLVVTSHRATGLPLIISTTATLPLFTAIVARLPDHGGSSIDAADLADALVHHPSNLREALLELYDHVEARARSGAGDGAWLGSRASDHRGS
jgi:hypothetical protein